MISDCETGSPGVASRSARIARCLGCVTSIAARGSGIVVALVLFRDFDVQRTENRFVIGQFRDDVFDHEE